MVWTYAVSTLRDYLGKEVPNVNLDLGKPKLVFHDGKDWLICPKHNDNAIMKCTYSSKNERDACRGITWSTASGLVFETTSLFGGRAGERALVRLYCSLGNKCAPVEEWEDIALNESLAEGDDTFWTALSDVLSASEFDSVVDRLSRGDSFVGNGSLDDGVLLTGQASGLAREGIVDDDDDSSDDKANDSSPTAASSSTRDIFSVSAALDSYDEMVQMAGVNAHASSERNAPI